MRYLYIITLSVWIISCNNSAKSDFTSNENSSHTKYEYFKVNLENAVDNDFKFDDLFYEFPVYSLEKKYPTYHNDKLHKLIGVPILDSFKLITRNLQLKPFLDQVNKKNNHYDEIKNSSLKFQFNVLSGFLEDSQYLLPDINHDLNFNNDKVFEFNKNFRLTEHPELFLSKVSAFDFKYEVSSNGEVYELNRMVKLYPRTNHKYTYLLDEGSLDGKINKYTAIFRFVDYKKGIINLNSSSNYVIGIQGISNKYNQIIIKPDSVHKSKSFDRTNFDYSINDTIRLGNDFYRIEDLSVDLNSIHFKKINLKLKNFKGFRIGDKMKNYSLTNLENCKEELLQIVDPKKEYILLDFWGTWCKPCIEHLPELKEFSRKFSNNVDIISVALDENSELVNNFILSNNMKWKHFIVDKKNRRGSIIQDLRVISYPTFILLDKDFTIIQRGGSNSFQKITKMVE